MSNLIAELFILIRNTRALLVAIALLCSLIWVLLKTDNKRIDYQEVSGKLIEINSTGDPNDPMFFRGKVLLGNGTLANITMSIRPPVPEIGTQVPVIIEHYEDGRTLYGFNNAQWIADGGITH